MVLSITAVLQGIDVRLEESARVLGAGRWQAFRDVTLPLSLDGIATGCTLGLRHHQWQLPDHAAARRRQGADAVAADLPAVQPDAGCRLRRRHGQRVLLVAAMACVALQGRFLTRRGDQGMSDGQPEAPAPQAGPAGLGARPLGRAVHRPSCCCRSSRWWWCPSRLRPTSPSRCPACRCAGMPASSNTGPSSTR